jgi:DNA-binding NarL/FixJ family response regulator
VHRKYLRRQEHPEARVVMVSSVGYQDNILAALQKGARHFAQKPVKPDALYEIIRYVLNDDGVTATVVVEKEHAR